MPSSAFENFEYAHNRLDALYMQVFEEQMDFTDEIFELLQELFILHIVAVAEAYASELTTEILGNHLSKLASSKRAKRSIVRILTSPGISSWDDALEEILEKGTRLITDDYNLETWITSWLPKNGIHINLSQDDHHFLQEVLASRNLFAHHRGVITSTYIRSTTSYYQYIGQPVPLAGTKRSISPQYCKVALNLFQRIISAIDNEAVKALP